MNTSTKEDKQMGSRVALDSMKGTNASGHSHSSFKSGRVYDLVLLIVIALLTYRSWFGPGFIMHGDLHAWSKEKMLDYFSMPYAWETAELGGYYSVGLPSILYMGSLSMYPLLFLQAVIVNYANADFGLVERILYFFPFPFVAALSMYYLCYLLFRKRAMCFFSSLLFISNSHILWRASSGFVTGIMSYALAPLALAFLVKSLDGRNTVRDAILSGLISAVIFFYEVRIGYLILGVLLSYAVFHVVRSLVRDPVNARKAVVKSIKILGIMATVLICLHAFWILPSLFARMPTLPAGRAAPASAEGLSFSSFGTVLALSWELWPYPIVWPTAVVITVLVFSSIVSLWFCRDAKVVYLFSLYILFGFLAKGLQPPMPEIYLWLYSYFPGFNAFREPLKFLFVEAIPYALLFGVGVESLRQLLIAALDGLKFIEKTLGMPRQLVKWVLSAIMIIVVAINMSPVLQDQVAGTFKPERLSDHYYAVDEMIERLPTGFRTLWFPNEPQYMGYDREHPAVYVGAFSSDLDQYLSGHIFFQNTTRYYSKLIGLQNVKYVIVAPEDEQVWQWHPENRRSAAVESILEYQRGLERIEDNGGYRLFENLFVLPHFYLASHNALAVGGRHLLVTLAPHLDFSQCALLFSDQLRSRSFEILGSIDTVVIEEGKTLDDLVMALVPDRFRVNLWEYAAQPASYRSGVEGNWIRSSPSTYLGRLWTQELGEIPGNSEGLVETQSVARMEITRKIEKSGEYDFWLRAGFTPSAGTLILQIDGNEVDSVLPVSSKKSLRWTKLGSHWMGEGRHTFALVNYGGENVLDELVVISRDSYLDHESKVLKTISDKNLFHLQSESDVANLGRLVQDSTNGQVRWERIDPTRYELTISLTRPSFLVFSETYDPLWVLRTEDCEVSSIIAYSGLNGFPLRKEGNVRVIVVFSAQRYVLVGSVIAGLTAFAITAYLIIDCRPSMSRKRLFKTK